MLIMEVREVMRKTVFRNFIVTERERKKKSQERIIISK